MYIFELRRKPTKKNEDNLEGTSLIHFLSYKHHWIYRFVYTSLLEITLASGEDPEKEADGRTAPLMVAAASNNVAAVKILLEEGANPNHKNKAGWSATMLACQQDTEYEKNGTHVG